MFLRVVYTFFTLFVVSAFVPVNTYAQDDSEYIIQLDPSSEILVSGNVTVGRIRFLTHGEYTQQFYENKLSPLDIVIIDQFPTELDPFPLAGVITESPVQSGCHMERQAKQIQIPFLTFKDASSNTILRNLSKVNGLLSFEVDPLQKVLKIKTNVSNKEAENIFRSRIKTISVSEYKEPYDVIQPLRDVPRDKLEHYGQKLSNLYMASNGMTNWAYPDVIGIPADVGLELQRSTYIRVNGKKITLSKAIRMQMEKINSLDLFSDDVPVLLNEIQSWFNQISYNPKIFGRLISIIDTRFEKEGGIFVSLRFRSSNRVENEIGAGVYRSMLLKYNELISREARVQEIFRNYIEVQKSLYTTRAYLLRRMFGLNESLTDIACGVHLSKNDLKANGVASLEEVNKYKILKIVSHPPDGSGTSPTSDGFYEVVYVIKDPQGEIYFSPDGIISSRQEFEPNLKTINVDDIKSLFNEMTKSKINWRQRKPLVQNSIISFEWGITKKNNPIIFDVKDSKDNLKEITPIRSEFNIDPVYNDILNKLGFQEFYESLKAQSSDQNQNEYETEIPYLYVEINNRNVLLTFSVNRSHENAFKLISENFKQQNVKLLSAGTVEAKTGIDHIGNIEILTAEMSEMIIDGVPKRNLTDTEAKSLLFSLFASYKFRIGSYSSLNITQTNKIIKNAVKQLFITNDFKRGTIHLGRLVQFLRKEIYGISTPPPRFEPFSNIAPDVAKVLVDLGLRDFNEMVLDRAEEHPFSIVTASYVHILMAIDGIPKIVVFKRGAKNDHEDVVNKIVSKIELLPQKHQFKILQFGAIEAEISYPNKLFSLDFSTSKTCKKSVTFETLLAFIEAVRSTGIEFTPQTRFLTGVSSDAFDIFARVFPGRNVETITFDDIVEEGKKRGFAPSIVGSSEKTKKLSDPKNPSIEKNGGDVLMKGLAIGAALQVISQHVFGNGSNPQETANLIFTSAAVVPKIMKQWQALSIREQMKYSKKFAELAIQYAGKNVFNAVKNRVVGNAAEAVIATREQFGNFAAALFFASFFQTLDRALTNNRLSFDDFTQWLTSLPRESIRFLTFSGGSAAASGMLKLMNVLQVKALALPEMEAGVKVYGIGFIRNQVLMAAGILVNKLIFGYQGDLTDGLVHDLGNFIKAELTIDAAKITVRSLVSGRLILNVAKRPGIAGFLAIAVELGGKIFLSGKFAEWESIATLSRHMSYSWYALQQSYLAADLREFGQKVNINRAKSNLHCLKDVQWENLSVCLSGELLQSLQAYLLAAQFQPIYSAFHKRLETELALETAYGIVLNSSGLGDIRILRNAYQDIYHTVPEIRDNVDSYKQELSHFFNAQTNEVVRDEILKMAIEHAQSTMPIGFATKKTCSAEEWSQNIFKCIDQEVTFENATLRNQVNEVQNLGLRYVNGKDGRISDASDYESNTFNEVTGNAPNGYTGGQYKTSQFLRGLMLQATDLCHDVDSVKPENMFSCLMNAKSVFSFVQNVNDSLTDKKAGINSMNAMIGNSALQAKITQTTWFPGAKVNALATYPMITKSSMISLIEKTPGVLVVSRFDKICNSGTLEALTNVTGYITKKRLSPNKVVDIQKFWKRKFACDRNGEYRLPTEKEWEDYKESQSNLGIQSQILIPILRIVNQNFVLNNHAAPDQVISLSAQEVATLESITVQ